MLMMPTRCSTPRYAQIKYKPKTPLFYGFFNHSKLFINERSIIVFFSRYKTETNANVIY